MRKKPTSEPTYKQQLALFGGIFLFIFALAGFLIWLGGKMGWMG